VTTSRTVPTVCPNLWGLSVTTTTGQRVTFTQSTDPNDGPTGVREPRRPNPPTPLAAAVTLDAPA